MGICIQEGKKEDIPYCVRIACESEIGKRYEFAIDTLTTAMEARLSAGALLLVAKEGDHSLGFAWVEPKGAFGIAPYLKLIVVDQTTQRTGIGSLLLNAFEERTAAIGNAWLLLVSDFNEKAISFYRKHGYSIVGRLLEFARKNIDELLMYKKHP